MGKSPSVSHLQPTLENGLTATSQVQIDKVMTLPRGKLGAVIGRLTERQMQEVMRLLALWVGVVG